MKVFLESAADNFWLQEIQKEGTEYESVQKLICSWSQSIEAV